MKSNEEIMSSEMLWEIDQFKDLDGLTCMVKLPDCGTCSVFCGRNEDGMEHVSVSPRKRFDRLSRDNIPTWNDMCILKDIFWDKEEEVYQIHPKESEYVNLEQNCLHLWKPIVGELKDLYKYKTSMLPKDFNADAFYRAMKKVEGAYDT